VKNSDIENDLQVFFFTIWWACNFCWIEYQFNVFKL